MLRPKNVLAFLITIVLSASSPLFEVQEKADEIPETESVTTRLEIVEPATISAEEMEKAKKYVEYQKAFKAWLLKALEVAERLEEDGQLYAEQNTENSDSNSVHVQPPIAGVGFTSSMRHLMAVGRYNDIRFPKSVLDKMPDRPESVPVPVGAKLKMKFVITNNQDRAIAINADIYCDVSQIDLRLTGSGAHRIPRTVHVETMDWRTGKSITLQPGESHSIEIKRLAFGKRGHDGNWLITKTGEYKIQLSYFSRQYFPSTRNKPLVFEVASAKLAVVSAK